MLVSQGRRGESGPLGEGIAIPAPLLLSYSKAGLAAGTAGVPSEVPRTEAQRRAALAHSPVLFASFLQWLCHPELGDLCSRTTFL